ncbi:MAG: hypothetical protein L3K17_05635, partial [Thermoplasmata archaeon]|nr:hypothetical protein [Thermoplasmata archaeon]
PMEPSSEDVENAWREFVYLLALPESGGGWRMVAYPAHSVLPYANEARVRRTDELPEEGARWRT